MDVIDIVFVLSLIAAIYASVRLGWNLHILVLRIKMDKKGNQRGDKDGKNSTDYFSYEFPINKNDR